MQRQPATVVHVVQSLRPGGTERRLLTLLAALDRSRYRPVLVCVDELGELAPDAEAAGVPPIVLGRRRRWDPSGALRLARLVRDERAEIVHGWLFLANAYARVGGRLGRAPFVVAAEGGAVVSRDPRRLRASRLLESALAPLTDAYVANSAATAAGLRDLGAPPAKIEIVHNGVSPVQPVDPAERERIRAALGARTGTPLVVMVARLDAEFKDHTGFLRSVAELPGVAAAVVGDGPGRADAEQEAARLGVADRVAFTGFRADARRILASADVSVLLSYSEGLSNTLLESMAAGVPVVATDIPGNREAVRDGVDGLLVPVGDAAATASAIERLIQDVELARSLGEAARVRIEEGFSPEAQALATMALYDRLRAARR